MPTLTLIHSKQPGKSFQAAPTTINSQENSHQLSERLRKRIFEIEIPELSMTVREALDWLITWRLDKNKELPFPPLEINRYLRVHGLTVSLTEAEENVDSPVYLQLLVPERILKAHPKLKPFEAVINSSFTLG